MELTEKRPRVAPSSTPQVRCSRKAGGPNEFHSITMANDVRSCLVEKTARSEKATMPPVWERTVLKEDFTFPEVGAISGPVCGASFSPKQDHSH